MKTLFQRFISVSLLLSLVPVTVLSANNSLQNPSKEFRIPKNAQQISDTVYYLGTSFDKDSGKPVEGYAIIHKKSPTAKSNSARSPKAPARYGFLADGAKWKSVEPWLMNPANTESLDEAVLFSLMNSAISVWEDAAEGVVGNGSSLNILGVGGATSTELTVDETSPDGQNEVYFGSIADANAIAVTTVWGYFGGSKFSRQLLEWDMVFDQNDFDWSTSGDALKMDFLNIATHELGHALGLDDIYQAGCSEVTMYGYGTEGETKKQTLDAADIKGISTLY